MNTTEENRLESDPYTPPAADVEVVNANAGGFYVVSIAKFSILYFTTIGAYGFYWFYRNWSGYRSFTGERIWPVPRALFSIFFAHSLYLKIDRRLEERQLSHAWSPRGLATGYVVLSVLSNILDRLSMRGMTTPLLEAISLLMLPAIYLTLLTPQKVINKVEGDPSGSSNSQLTLANAAWIALGLLIWGAGILGYLVELGVIEG